MHKGSGLFVQNVSLSINDGSTKKIILNEAELSIRTKEILALLGTSGSGKTSLLRIIAGLQNFDGGHIFIDNVDVTRSPPEARGVAMLFQEPALFPAKTTMENALAARMARRTPKREINDAKTEISHMMDHFQMTKNKKKQASVLSGGEFQRAAIVRCLANATYSKLVLLDEPFQSNLNFSLRWALMEWFKGWLERTQLTCLLVTHDFAEAAYFANNIAVIDEDKHSIITGKATTLYNKPPNLTIAKIVGPVNLWELSKFDYNLPVSELQPNPVFETGAEWCMCRPSSVLIEPNKTDFEVTTQTFLGAAVRVELRSIAFPDFEITAEVSSSRASKLQQRCGVQISRDHVSFYDDKQDRIEGADDSQPEA